MKEIILALLLTISAIVVSAQTTYKEGYFIDNEDQRITCLIKSVDWRDNPSGFEYKLSDDRKLTATIKDVKEFGIGRELKFIRATVNMDQSSGKLSDLSTKRSPEWREETIFLKVLVESVSLLYYEQGDIKRFFYSVDGAEIEQLVHKEYRTSSDEVSVNNDFLNQIRNTINCSNRPVAQLEQLTYTTRSLVQYFRAHNECLNATVVIYKPERTKGSVNLKFTPGISMASCSFHSDASRDYNFDFEDQLSFRLGMEVGFVMPFNNNKWEAILEPTYRYFTSTALSRQRLVEIDYTSLELPIGFRHNFFLSTQSKAFVSVSYVLDFLLNSAVHIEGSDDLELGTLDNFMLGMGYGYKRFSLEARYYTPRSIASSYIFLSARYDAWSVVLGYKIVK